MNKIIFWSGIWNISYTRPIGTYQLSYWLRQNNIESQVIEFCQFYTAEELFELTIKFISTGTKYIGISSSFWGYETMPDNISESINLVRKHYKDIKIIIGGPRANSKNIKDIADIIILGEAEDKLLNLIKGINIGNTFDITKLEHRFVDKDCILDEEVLPIELGRGCIFKCKFCGHHNLGKPKYTYQRNINLIEQEIAYNFEKFKTTKYMYLDDTVNEDPEKIFNLSKIPKKLNIPLSWTGYLRADLIWANPDSIEQLIDSGLESCFFGIETLNEKSSISIGKGWSGKHAKTFLPKLYNEYWNKNINIWANFIIGLPYEDRSSLNSTVEWCLSNQIGYYNFVPLTLYLLRTDTGTKSFFSENYKNYGYDIDSGGLWKNEYLNEPDAQKISKDFNTLISKNNKLSSWDLFNAANCGIELNILKKIKKFRLSIFENKFKNTFLNIYKEKLIKLS